MSRLFEGLSIALQYHRSYMNICATEPSHADEYLIEDAGTIIGTFVYACENAAVIAPLLRHRIRRLTSWQNKAYFAYRANEFRNLKRKSVA